MHLGHLLGGLDVATSFLSCEFYGFFEFEAVIKWFLVREPLLQAAVTMLAAYK